jgi:hypothetical protein
LELAEAELAGLLHAPPSESRDARIHHLTELLEVMNKLVELRREEARLRKRPGEPKLRAVRIEIAQLRLRERFLTKLDETPWAHGPGSVDEAQLLEFQRQLIEGLVTDQRLAEIERALDAMDPTDADWAQAVLEEAADVDETIGEWEELLNENPSPERAPEIQSSFERLQQELREERAAVEGAVSALANVYANIQTTQAGSSSGPTWQERLRAIHQEQSDLLAQWQRRLRTRLNSAQQRLNFRRRVPALHNEAVEAELGREIALLERELRLAGG